MNILDKNELPKWQCVKYDIELKIITGEYKGGERVPSVHSLSNLYSIGTSTPQSILEKMAQEAAYRLTLEVINNWEKEGRPVGKPQEKTGKYYSREDFEKAKKIDLNSSAEEIERKIRAFYCPPYEGAYIEIEGKHFQLLPLNH